jgi:putative spermidine/putrescine transport system permease protein
MTARLIRIGYLAAVVLGCLFLLAPTLVVALASVSPTATLRFPPEGFSLRWYENFFARPEFMTSLRLSAVLATSVAIVSTALAVLLAVSLRRNGPVVGAASRTLVLVPAVLPSIVLGPALLIFGAQTGLTRDLPGALFLLAGAHVALTLPFAWQAVATGYASLPTTLEEAAEVSGGGRLRILARVVVPLLLPGIIASLTFAFLVSFDEPVVALFLTRHDMATLPAQVFTYLRFRADPTIAALSTMMSLVSLCLMLVADRVVGLDRIMGLSR